MLKDLFSTNFLFHINRVSIESADKALLTLGVVALLMAVVFKIAARLAPTPVDTKFRNRLATPFLFSGIGELVWYGARYQNIPYVGTHFVALAVVLAAVVWFLLIFVKMLWVYKGEKLQWEKEQMKRKYLPK